MPVFWAVTVAVLLPFSHEDEALTGLILSGLIVGLLALCLVSLRKSGTARGDRGTKETRALQSQISALAYENEGLQSDLDALRGSGHAARNDTAFQHTMQALQRDKELLADDLSGLTARLRAEKKRRKRADERFASVSTKLSEAQKEVSAERAARKEAEARAWQQTPSDDLEAFTFSTLTYEDALWFLGFENEGFAVKDLKTRMRNLQTKCHPDGGGTKGLSALVNHAYDVVSGRM